MFMEVCTCYDKKYCSKCIHTQTNKLSVFATQVLQTLIYHVF